MNIPDPAIPYILFQRTAYLRLPVTPVYRLLDRLLPMPTPFYNIAVAIESRLGRERVRRRYRADMAAEYASIRSYLPDRCRAILDVGCGVAGIDVSLARHYGGSPPDLYLLDRSQVDPGVYYLFRERGSFYNSLSVARDLLLANGVAPERIRLVEARDDAAIPIPGPVDLVLSLLSWGFHYPVDHYLEPVRALLSQSGVVILDARKGTDGLATLRDAFPNVEVVLETDKYVRVAAGRGAAAGGS